MNKTIAGIIIGVAIAGGAIFALTRPEPVPPTPKERLAEAAEDIRAASKEAAQAASEAAEDAGEALVSSATDGLAKMKSTVGEAYAGMAEEVAETSQETVDQLKQFLDEWKESGIVTKDGIDFDKAQAAVEESDLSVGAKANIVSILTAARNAPGAIEEKLGALETLLGA